MLQDYNLEIYLKELLGKEILGEKFTVKLMPKFVEDTNPKQHNFTNHMKGFVSGLQQHHATPADKQIFTKRSIYVVSFGMNTGSEINGDRPSIVYKATHSTLGDDVVVIPLTSRNINKQNDNYDVYIGKNDTNKLYQSSYARLRQIRSVSVKRLGKKLGELTGDVERMLIDNGIKKMLGVDK